MPSGNKTSGTTMASSFWETFCAAEPELAEFSDPSFKRDAIVQSIDMAKEFITWANSVKTGIHNIHENWINKVVREPAPSIAAMEQLFHQEGFSNALNELLHKCMDLSSHRCKSVETWSDVNNYLLGPLSREVVSKANTDMIVSFIRCSLGDHSLYMTTRVMIARILTPSLSCLLATVSGVADGLAQRLWSDTMKDNKSNDNKAIYLNCLKAQDAVWLWICSLRVLHDLKELQPDVKLNTSVVELLSKLRSQNTPSDEALRLFAQFLPSSGDPRLGTHRTLPKLCKPNDQIGRRLRAELERIFNEQGIHLYGDITRRIEPILSWLAKKLYDLKSLLNYNSTPKWLDCWVDQDYSPPNICFQFSGGKIDVDELLDCNTRPVLLLLADYMLCPRWQLLLRLKSDVNRKKCHRVPLHVKNATTLAQTQEGLHAIIDELYCDDVASVTEFLDALKIPNAELTLLEMSNLGACLMDETPSAVLSQSHSETTSRLPWTYCNDELNLDDIHPDGISWYTYWVSLEHTRARTEWTKWISNLLVASDVPVVGGDITSVEAKKIACTLGDRPGLALLDLMKSSYPHLTPNELPSRFLHTLSNLMNTVMRRSRPGLSHHAQEKYLECVVAPFIESFSDACKTLWNAIPHDSVDNLLSMAGLLHMLHLTSNLDTWHSDTLRSMHLRQFLVPVFQLFEKALDFYADSIQKLITATPHFLYSEVTKMNDIYDDVVDIPPEVQGMLYRLPNEDQKGFTKILEQLSPGGSSRFALPAVLFELILSRIIEKLRQPTWRQVELLPKLRSQGRSKLEHRRVEETHRFFQHCGMAFVLDIQNAASGNHDMMKNNDWYSDEKEWAEERLRSALGCSMDVTKKYTPSAQIVEPLVAIFAQTHE